MEDIGNVVNVRTMGHHGIIPLLHADYLQCKAHRWLEAYEYVTGLRVVLLRNRTPVCIACWPLIELQHQIIFLCIIIYHVACRIQRIGIHNTRFCRGAGDITHTRVVLHLRLNEAYRVDSREHDAVGGVGSYNLLRYIIVILHAKSVQLRVSNLQHLVVEEGTEVTVVLIDIESRGFVLCPCGQN